MHLLTALAMMALIAASIRCVLLAIFTIENFSNTNNLYDNSSHAFDLIHSFIQSIHVIEYSALIYGIGGFYLYAVIERNNFLKLNDTYKESFRCRCSCTSTGVAILCGLSLFLFISSTYIPVAILTEWKYEIVRTKPHLHYLTKMYVGISYISHTCHFATRIFMIYVTVVIRYAWLNQAQPKLKVDVSGSSLIAGAKFILRPKWLEDKLEDNDIQGLKENFTDLIDNYNVTGQFIAPLHGIFQQWFVMQWIVYFIKIIEDFAIVINSLIDEQYTNSESRHEVLFVFTHLIFDLILFLVPYYCASLLNQYHEQYHARLQRAQKNILCNEVDGWRLQCAPLIPENPNYSFIPSFCGLSIPLSSPGYNLSIILALFAFIISIITTIH